MKAIVIGMGVQGQKRKFFLGKDFICSVDTKKKADYVELKKVPLNIYDTAYVCTPDNFKMQIIDYLIKNKKNILVEKPLLASHKKLIELQNKSYNNEILIYTAYNHRFEPSLIEVKKIIKNKKLGKIYSLKLFYGNGTAKLVKKSLWRDKNRGIITDLGSHLFDLCIFLFNRPLKKISLIKSKNFENKTPDHALIYCEIDQIQVFFEITYTMWKNSFFLDIIGSKGSLHVNSLCKWSDSILTFRKRIFPSGTPKEFRKIYKKGDPTWKKENDFFKTLIKSNSYPDIKKDFLINSYLQKL